MFTIYSLQKDLSWLKVKKDQSNKEENLQLASVIFRLESSMKLRDYVKLCHFFCNKIIHNTTTKRLRKTFSPE